MKLLVTGAAGFLGRYVVSEAIRRGHSVRALIRPSTRIIPKFWEAHPQIQIIRGDLRTASGLTDIITGVDGVIHLAATKAGDFYEQFAGTVISTENLLSAMSNAGIERITLTSSFAVYEYLKRMAWGVIDESSQLSTDPLTRDEYCQTKLIQERITLTHAKANNWRCMILRPGVVFGRDNLWTGRLGMQANKQKWVSTGMFAPLPLTYVENTATAIVLASEYDGPERIMILNVVDGKTPIQYTYLKALSAVQNPHPYIIRVPWSIMRISARLIWIINIIFFKGTAKVPGLFVPSRLHAMCKPFRYTNRKIVSVLGWKPQFTWREGIDRSLQEEAE